MSPLAHPSLRGIGFLPPEEPNLPVNAFRAYKLKDMAPAYFVHNAIEYLCERSVLDNNQIWYPTAGKQAYTLGEIPVEGA